MSRYKNDVIVKLIFKEHFGQVILWVDTTKDFYKKWGMEDYPNKPQS